MRNVLYLHGFASSPRGRKVGALEELLGPDGVRVIAPDLNIPSFERLSFRAMSRLAFWEIKRHMPAAVVGSSLGAAVALEAARGGLKAPLVLLAPALGFGPRWTERLPPGDPLLFFHHGEGREVPIHRRFFEEMAQMDSEAEPPEVPVTILMGSRDENVPLEGVREVWRRWEETGRLLAGSRFVEIEGADHGLVDHVDRIAGEIRRVIAKV